MSSISADGNGTATSPRVERGASLAHRELRKLLTAKSHAAA
jgi:hypothetical protein